MTTKATIRRLIDNSEQEMEACWNILVMLKEQQVPNDWISQVLDFQPRLASVIFRLDAMYRDLRQERKLLLGRRRVLSRRWFDHRLKSIETYCDALKEILSLCKALGDSFACFFYDNSREHLFKHIEHEPIRHTPAGVGGQGELEFIRQIKHINGQMVIYHGTTTFLRLGDVSLIDLKTLTVTAIGELKTKCIGPNQLQIGLYLIGGQQVAEIIQIGEMSTNNELSDNLPPPAKERLQRQLKAMSAPFIPTLAGKQIVYKGDSHMSALAEMAEEASTQRSIYKQAGEGLLLIGLRPRRKRSLYSRLLERSRVDWSKYMGPDNLRRFDIVEREQVGKAEDANCVHLGHLAPGFLIGTVPMFWWPVKTEFLRKLFFSEIIVMTIYNPAHLARKLRAVGFAVTLQDGGKLRVAKPLPVGEFQLHGMEYFVHTVQDYLLEEEYIVSLLCAVIEDVQGGKIPPQAQIDLRLHWKLGISRRTIS